MATVNLPDGTALNFPDGMSPADMKAAADTFLAQRRQSGLNPVEAAGENVGTGLYKGLSYVGAMPRTIADQTGKWAAGMRANSAARYEAFAKQHGLTQPNPMANPAGDYKDLLPTAEDIQKNVLFGPDSALGIPEYKPETGLGRVVQTTAAGVSSGAVGGGAGALLGGVGGAAQQGAAEVGLPPWAQMAAGLGLPLAAGGAAALARPGAVKAVENSIRNLSPADLTAAGALMRDAKAAGTNLTWPEAINQVTNGGARRLSDVQRVVEQSAGGSPTMSAFMAQRAPGNATAMQRQLDRIGPEMQGQAAGDVPATLQGAAEGAVTGAQKARSAATKPFYRAAGADQVPVADMRATIAAIDAEIARQPADVVVAQLRALRQDLIAKAATPGTPASRTQTGGTPSRPIYSSTPAVPGQPEIPRTSIESLDSARKYWRDKLELPAIAPGATDAETAARTAPVLSGLRDQMTRASPDFAYGKALHADLSERVVEPMKRSPVGGLAKAPPSLQAQRQIIAPLGEQGALDPAQVGATAREIGRQSPTALRDWVRININSLFKEATQDNIPGANQYGGAKFRAQTMGNADQAANLKALITALPNGQTVWPGYKRLMEIFEGQGKRQAPGSMTEFNKQITEDLGGGKINLQVISKVQDAIQRFRYGGNAGALAEMFTDPAYADMWQTLALAPRRMARAPLGILPQPQITDQSRGR